MKFDVYGRRESSILAPSGSPLSLRTPLGDGRNWLDLSNGHINRKNSGANESTTPSFQSYLAGRLINHSLFRNIYHYLYHRQPIMSQECTQVLHVFQNQVRITLVKFINLFIY